MGTIDITRHLTKLNVIDTVTPVFRCDTGRSFLDHLFDSCQVERQVLPINVACNVRMERQSCNKYILKSL